VQKFNDQKKYVSNYLSIQLMNQLNFSGQLSPNTSEDIRHFGYLFILGTQAGPEQFFLENRAKFISMIHEADQIAVWLQMKWGRRLGIWN
jgi:hypothetical protein